MDFELAHVGQISNKLNATYYQQLLVSSREQLIKSQTIFDKHFSESQDSSTNREHAISMQALATVMCLQKDFKSGAKQWERTIQKARNNMKGIIMGPPVELLSLILYNAAACLTEDMQLDKAYQLINECIQLKSHHNKANEVKDNKDLETIISLKKLIEESIKNPNANANTNTHSNTKEIKTLSSSFSDEWEECEEGEEGCEEFYIDDDNNNEDDEAKELAEIRARYAEQSKRYVNSEAKPNANTVISSDTPANSDEIVHEMKAIRAEINNLLERLVKLEKIIL
jgi:hypothetical protein